MKLETLWTVATSGRVRAMGSVLGLANAHYRLVFLVLEVGCGSGVYLRFMAERNPQLTAQGLELQPKVAEAAANNLAAWGVEGRVSVATGDVRGLAPDERYDVVTLHNNIYYFEEAARTEVLRGLLARLVPGGTLLVTTACRGGSAAIAMLNLWGAMTQGCGRLPTPEELCAQLRDAGADEVRAHHVGAPVQSFWAFTAKAPR